MIRRLGSLVVIMGVALAPPAIAEIAKTAVTTKAGLETHWWPMATLPPNWHVDDGASRLYNCKAMAPNGLTFETAQSVMYACAAWRGRDSDAADLEGFVRDDQSKFRADDPRMTWDRLADETMADGRPLQLYRISPAQGANWEIVAYGEEKDAEGQDYFLTFVVSGRSAVALSKAEMAFKAMLRAYK